MIKIIKKQKLDKVDKTFKTVGNNSVGHNHVYSYLNKTLSKKNMEKFAKHLSKCSSCLDIVVKWHYESVVDGMYENSSNAECDDSDCKGNWGGSPKKSR